MWVVNHCHSLPREVVDAPGNIQGWVGQGSEQPGLLKVSLLIAGALD